MPADLEVTQWCSKCRNLAVLQCGMCTLWLCDIHTRDHPSVSEAHPHLFHNHDYSFVPQGREFGG